MLPRHFCENATRREKSRRDPAKSILETVLGRWWCLAFFVENVGPGNVAECLRGSRNLAECQEADALPSPLPFPGLCSSIHPKRERFGRKKILSKYLRKPNKWGTDVSLRVLRGYHRARVLGFFGRRFVPRFGRRLAPLLGPLLYSARFTCLWAFRLSLRQIPSGKGRHFLGTSGTLPDSRRQLDPCFAPIGPR